VVQVQLFLLRVFVDHHTCIGLTHEFLWVAQYFYSDFNFLK
jgi:hypothetical protein